MSHQKKEKESVPGIRGVHQDSDKSNQPDLIRADPPATDLWASAVNDGLLIPETESGGLVGGFSPLKPALTNLTRDFKNPEIQAFFQLVFGQITSNPTRFMPDLWRSQLGLVEISPNLVRSHQIRWDLCQI